MEELKICSVSDEYIEFLHQRMPNVYSNKRNTRKHSRKYLGIVLRIGNYNYYVPMSSPKNTDYQIAGNQKVIKKSIVPVIRVITRNSQGEKQLLATLRISHMIPVPDKELILYDIENESDSTYKDLIQNEIIYIRKNREKIVKNAELLYKQKIRNDESAGYVKSALNFQELEVLCDEFTQINK